MITGIYNLCVGEGVTLQPQVFRLMNTADNTPIDLTGLGVRATIRPSYTSGEVLAVLDTTVGDPLTGEITMGLGSDHGMADNISPLKFNKMAEVWPTLTCLSTEQTRLFNPGIGPYVWDLEVYNNDVPPLVIRYLTGMVVVTSEVTL